MVRQTYCNLDAPEAAVKAFDALTPHVAELVALERGCGEGSPDEAALAVAIAAIETAAYHFTRRRHYFDHLKMAAPENPGRPLTGREEAAAAFKALTPLMNQLRAMQARCRPFGRDYMAVEVAKRGLETAAYHFTRNERFYAIGDAAGGHP